MGSGAVGENLESVEEVFEGLGGGLGLAFGPEFGEAVGAEFDAFGIEGFVEAVGGEQDGVSGSELDDVLTVAGSGEKSGGKSAFADGVAVGGGGVEGKWEPGVGEAEGAVESKTA